MKELIDAIVKYKGTHTIHMLQHVWLSPTIQQSIQNPSIRHFNAAAAAVVDGSTPKRIK